MITLTEINQYFYEKDYELYWKIKNTSRSLKDSIAGCIIKDGYIVVRFNKKKSFAHRILYQIYNNLEILPEGYLIDHVDGNPSNNSKENLRLATCSENACNKKIPSNNKTGYKGISILKNNNNLVYCACIHKNNIRYRKYFNLLDIESAKEWLDNIRKELHGEFSRNE